MGFLVSENHVICQAERRWIWRFAALVMAVTLLPYLIGFYQQGSEWRFTGLVFGVEDGNSYIAKMMTGSSGDWLFRTPFTAYPQPGIILFFPYILLGKLASPPGLHEQLTGLHGIYRMAAGFLAIHATYDFVALFLSEVKWRRLGVILAVLGGGLGWLTIVGFHDWFTWGLPLESYSPEAFGFLAILGIPHQAAARALLLWGLRDYLLGIKPFSCRKGWLRTAVIWIGVWFFQPLVLVVGLFVVCIYVMFTGLWQFSQGRRQKKTNWPIWKNYFFHAVRIALISSPFVIYTFLTFKLIPHLQSWESQSYIISPAPHVYFLGYAVALPLALLGIRSLLQEMSWRGILLGGWLLVAPFLAYAPFSSQRRLVEGTWVVISILAVSWIAKTDPRLQKLSLVWLILAFPTSLIVLTASFIFAWNPATPLFRPINEVMAFEYIAREAQPGDVVIAANSSSNPLPAWAPVRTLIGHGPESINGPVLRDRVNCFYSTICSETERINLLDEFDVSYVFWGPAEREIGAWDPRTSVVLQPVYAEGDYSVFLYDSSSKP